MRLLDAFGNVIDHVPYQDSLPWPIEADGDGFCLELRDVFSDNSIATNWRLAAPMLDDPDPDQFNIALFPNPSTGIINLRSDRELKQISITDLSGKEVLAITTSDTILDVDLSDLDSGIYTLSLFSQSGQVQIRKVSLLTF